MTNICLCYCPAARNDRGGFGASVADESSQWRRAGPLPPSEGPRGGGPGGPGGPGGYRSERGGPGGDRMGMGIGRRDDDGPSPFDSMEIGPGGRRSGFGSQFTPGGPPSSDRGGFRSSRYEGAGGPGGGDRPGGFGAGPGPMEPSAGDDAANWRTGKPVESREQRPSFTGSAGAGGPPQTPGAERRGPGFERKNSSALSPSGSTAAEDADTWRRSKPAAGPSSSSAQGSSEAPRERKKLELKPRGSTMDAPTSPAAPTTPRTGVNPFGNAAPVDAAAREREIEEKLRLKEQERKEEIAKKAAANQERKAAAAAASAASAAAASTSATKESDAEKTGEDASSAAASAAETAAAEGAASPATTNGSAAPAEKKAAKSNPPTNPWKKVEPRQTPSPSQSQSPAKSEADKSSTSPAAASAEKPAASTETPAAADSPAQQDSTTAAAAKPRTAPPANAWGQGRKAAGALSSASSVPAEGKKEDAGEEAAKSVEAVEIKE